MDLREHLIRDTPLLTRLRSEEIQALTAHGNVQTFQRGQVIFRQGDAGHALYLLLSGSVHITVLSTEGREATLAILGPGESFGDLAVLDGRSRSATAVAAQQSDVFVVSRDEFFRWLNEHPSATFALLEALSLRLRQKDERFADLAFLDVSRRLARRLLDLAAMRRTWTGDPTDGDVVLHITQDQLASSMGVTRQSVNAELQKFEERGWISLKRGTCAIRDHESLRTFSSTGER
jgi:CRP/FNR family transcriptional regulator, cyclic AMP receptor protein